MIMNVTIGVEINIFRCILTGMIYTVGKINFSVYYIRFTPQLVLPGVFPSCAVYDPPQILNIWEFFLQADFHGDE